MKKINVILAMGKNNEIGVKDRLPWKLSRDMKFFQQMTNNTTVIMGSSTYFSLPKKFRPLKNRINIVCSRDQEKKKTIEQEGAKCVESISYALLLAEYYKKDIFIIGGQQIYEQVMFSPVYLSKIDSLYITHVDTEIHDADKFFMKELDQDFWKSDIFLDTVYLLEHKADEKNDHSFVIRKYSFKNKILN